MRRTPGDAVTEPRSLSATTENKKPWGTCADCGLPYSDDGWADFVVSHEVWAKLTAEDGACLLCANCMTRRATRLGIEAEGRFTSGPFARRGWDDDDMLLGHRA
jgi:hypothetical protein